MNVSLYYLWLPTPQKKFVIRILMTMIKSGAYGHTTFIRPGLNFELEISQT